MAMARGPYASGWRQTMKREMNADRKDKMLASTYQSSWGTSMLTQVIVGLLEIFMLVYTLVNPDLFGQYIGIYRRFYVSLLTAAVVYIALDILIKQDIRRRHSC